MILLNLLNKNIMKVLFVLTVIQVMYQPVYTVGGVIWSKSRQKFVPIFSIPNYGSLKHERILNIRKLETHDFQGQDIRLSYFQEPNIFNIHKPNQKLTGIIPDIWYLLSDVLNFTLNPVLTEEHGIGTQLHNGSMTGLMKVIMENRTDVIPKIEMFSIRMNMVRYTLPFWKTRHRLYIQKVAHYDITWMVKLFTWKAWCAALIMYFVLTGCTYIAQTTASKLTDSKVRPDLNEHFFYNFGVFCSQSYIPDYLFGRSRLLEFLLGLFTSILKMAFSALLINCMMETIIIVPFDSFENLLDESSFKIVARADSLPDIAFKKAERYQRAAAMNRVCIVSTVEEMYRKTCSLTEKYALFEEVDKIRVSGKQLCTLESAGGTHFETWIAGAVPLEFQFKRAFDIAILKLHEFGIIPMLKDRWLEKQYNDEKHGKTFKPIVLSQVFLIQVAFVVGTVIAIAIHAIEHIIFYLKRSNTKIDGYRNFARKTK